MRELEARTLESIKRFSKRNVDALLDLFDDDATVYEPFSAAGVIKGRTEIESFLNVACRDTSFVVDLKSVKISTMKNAPNSTTAIVNVRKGTDANFVLDFDFAEQPGSRGRGNPKIRKLRIRYH